jgi:hypothetical protein
MRTKFIALVLSFVAMPAMGQTTLRGTPDETFRYVSHEEITKKQMTPWPGEVYASAFTSDHEYFFVEFVKRLDHGNYIEQHTHWIDQTTILAGDAILMGWTPPTASMCQSGGVETHFKESVHGTG